MQPCTHEKRTFCKVCDRLLVGRCFSSSLTRKCFAPTHTADLRWNCDIKNVVYLIQCSKCQAQYVGQTSKTFRTRMMQHLAPSMKNRRNSLYMHFYDGCGIDNFRCRIIARLDDNSTPKELLTAENIWIRLLNSIRPIGLNDRVSGVGIIGSLLDFRFNYSGKSPFMSINTPRFTRSHGVRQKLQRNGVFNIGTIRTKFDNDVAFYAHWFNKLNTLSKANRQLLYAKIVSENYCTDFKDKIMFLKDIVIKENDSNQKSRFATNIFRWLIPFKNKLMEKVNLKRIFRNHKVTSTLTPNQRRFLETVVVTHTYEPPISLRLYNYSRFLRDLDMQQLIGWLDHRCSCEDSEYTYAPLGHIITGNLNIVNENSLKGLFRKGSKYRMNPGHDPNNVFKSIMGALGILLTKLKVIDTINLCDFVSSFRSRLKTVLDSLSYQVYKDHFTTAMYCELRRLHKQYVICPADKASNNYVFICKRLYAMAMCKELGIIIQDNKMLCQGNHTYRHTGEAKIENIKLIYKHKALVKHYGYETSKWDDQIPMLFAAPKLHKNPYKFRFIAGASKSSTKPICLLVHRILSFVKNKVQAYCAIATAGTGVQHYWAVDGSLEALKRIISSRTNYQSVGAADFSTLYPSLPHSIVYKAVYRLIDLVIRDGYIAVQGLKVWHAHVFTNKAQVCLSIPEVKQLIQESIQETYVTFAGQVFQQVLGCPQGGSHSPVLATLTLTGLEFDFIKAEYMKSNAKQFNTIIRFVDDILFLNCPNFIQLARKIYPVELPLEATHDDNLHCNFLDMTLHIDNKLEIKPYDKTDAFPFTVNKFPHINSNQHYKIMHNVYNGRLIVIGRVSTKLEYLIARVKQMNTIFEKKGMNRKKMENQFAKFASNNASLLTKFGVLNKQQLIRLMQDIF